MLNQHFGKCISLGIRTTYCQETLSFHCTVKRPYLFTAGNCNYGNRNPKGAHPFYYLQLKDRILYLTDNAGEVFFDVFVIRELIKMGKEVIVSPKSAPIINDATIEDLNMLY